MTRTLKTARTTRRRARGVGAGLLSVGALLVGLVLIGGATPSGADTTSTTGTSTTDTTSTITTTPVARRTIDVSARSYQFTPSKLQVTKGESVTIALKSTDAFHDFVVTGPGVSDKTVVKTTGAGKTRRGTLKLAKPGTYQFFCSTPGHRAAGMRGTIEVS